MIRNLLIAQAVIGIGLSGIYLLPKTFNIRQSAIVMSLPPKPGRLELQAFRTLKAGA